MNIKKTLESKIVDEVLKELDSMKGFDYFWHEIDEEIKKEAKSKMVKKVLKVIKNSKKPTKAQIERFVKDCKYEKQDF